MKKTNGNRKAVLTKHFRDYPDKVIYKGTLKGCKKRIPESKKDQFTISFIS